MSKLVVIASKNPVKINATLEGFAKMFPKQDFTFRSVEVPSGVSDQPMTDDETLKGATNRAQNARDAEPEADFWVGIEGGIHETPEGVEAFTWVYIQGQNIIGKSKSSTFYLPKEVIHLIRSGLELSDACDKVFKKKNSKQKEGMVGVLTGGTISRTEYYVQTVILALIPFKLN